MAQSISKSLGISKSSITEITISVILLDFLFNSLIVMLAYNFIGPKLSTMFSGTDQNFQELNYRESMAFVLLTGILFNRINITKY